MTEGKKALSIVVASGAGGEFIFRCLDSIALQLTDPQVELLIVDRCGGETLDQLRKRYPSATVIQTQPDQRLSVPELRTIGVEQAQGEIAAIIEEHCTAPHHWVETIRANFQNSDAAIGGPILDQDYPRIRDWVVYLSEYHNYLPPWSDEKRYNLNGANIAYRREKLKQFLDLMRTGYWEVNLHPRLIDEGDFRSVPEMGVYHTGPFNYGYYLEQRYLLSRVWGGTQRELVSTSRRIAYLVVAPVLPFLLLFRIASRVIGDSRLMRKFLMALPLLIPVAVTYVWGEWLGYLNGVGDALERVE